MRKAHISLLFVLFLTLPTTLISCASYFVRQECKELDWFKYGESVAMSGRRLTGDAMVRRCEEAEGEINHTALDQGFKKGMATYCKPETVFAMGRRGEFYAEEMCDGDNEKLLKRKHVEGVTAYCQKSNGYAAGATGKTYNQICPKELEGEFLVEFYRGRKTYLSAQVLQLEQEVEELIEKNRSLERKRNSLNLDLARLGDGNTIVREIKYNQQTGTRTEEIKVEQSDEIKRRRDSLLRDIESVDSAINANENAQQSLRSKIRELKTELLTLG